MSTPRTPPDQGAEPPPGQASGHGADTALEALIRQRKRVETHEEDAAEPPAPPLQE